MCFLHRVAVELMEFPLEKQLKKAVKSSIYMYVLGIDYRDLWPRGSDYRKRNKKPSLVGKGFGGGCGGGLCLLQLSAELCGLLGVEFFP